MQKNVNYYHVKWLYFKLAIFGTIIISQLKLKVNKYTKTRPVIAIQVSFEP